MDVADIAGRLTRGQKAMMAARHTPDGNPWPFIGIRERTGGAKDRTFQKMRSLGLYDQGNCLTPAGLAVRAHIQGNSHD